MSRGTGARVFTAMPVVVRGHVAGVVYASRTPSNVFKHLYDERRKVILAGLAILAATLAIGFTFSRFVTRPMHELIRRTADIGRGDRNAMRPLAHHGTREFAMLSDSFLAMARSLNDRSDYLRTFAAHVSHELKSPLTSIQGAAELLLESLGPVSSHMTDAERRRFLQNIVADAERLTAIVQRLRDLAPGGLSAELLDGDVAATLRDHAEEVGADLVVVGLQRRSPVGKALLGSNAQRILLGATCPVLAVRAHDTD
jgi:signal transduction histidine kinase